MGLKRILMDYIKRVGETMNSYHGVLGSKRSRLGPQEIRRLNNVYLIFCVFVLLLDPLFCCILVFNAQKHCLRLDTKLGALATVLRFFVDLFYIIHMVFQFRAAIVSPSSQASGQVELVKEMQTTAWRYLFFYFPADVFMILPLPQKKCLRLDTTVGTPVVVLRFLVDFFYIIHMVFQFRAAIVSLRSQASGRVEEMRAIARKYLFFYFPADVFVILPLPQVLIFAIVPKLNASRVLGATKALNFTVVFQYVLRLLRICSLLKKVTSNSGILAGTAWVNLFLYMLASHVVGAFWYLFSIERNVSCWSEACQNHTGVHCSLFCDNTFGARSFPNNSCSTKIPSSTPFNFGIYADALESGVVNDSADFVQKISYCFWWGLQNLSSLGQGLKTSTYVWEVYYAVFVSLSGLVLLSSLIGNMQTYLQLKTARLADMRSKEQEREYWMAFYALPPHLKKRIREYPRDQWQENTGVSMENFFLSLPREIRSDTKRHICLPLLMRVPMFEKMDEQLRDAMCNRLKPVLYTEESYIVREGDPVDEMLFIKGGRLLTMTTNGGRTGFLNCEYLKAGDFCGEELLIWALDPHTSANLPISTRTVKALSEVEAFALKADDLKFVASQFRRLHSKQLRHTFRFYSHQWRNWAATFIQAAWHRHMKKKLEESLREEENRLQGALANAGVSSPSLGATIYASRFAANTLRKARVPERLPAMLLQKPPEPDFNAKEQ